MRNDAEKVNGNVVFRSICELPVSIDIFKGSVAKFFQVSLY